MEATCVFCGDPLRADEPVSGRPPHAAHARCADAALADDSHWDAIAASEPAEEGDEPTTAGLPSRSSRTGCLGVFVVLLLLLRAAGRHAGERTRRGPRPKPGPSHLS